jgi:hypothetical protein
MNFKNWVKSIQTEGYNGAQTVSAIWNFLNKFLSTTARRADLVTSTGPFQYFLKLSAIWIFF